MPKSSHAVASLLALLRGNSPTIHLTHSECTIQWLLVYSSSLRPDRSPKGVHHFTFPPGRGRAPGSPRPGHHMLLGVLLIIAISVDVKWDSSFSWISIMAVVLSMFSCAHSQAFMFELHDLTNWCSLPLYLMKLLPQSIYECVPCLS